MFEALKFTFGTARVRERAVTRLGNRRNPSDISLIQHGLTDKDPGVVKATIHALSMFPMDLVARDLANGFITESWTGRAGRSQRPSRLTSIQTL